MHKFKFICSKLTDCFYFLSFSGQIIICWYGFIQIFRIGHIVYLNIPLHFISLCGISWNYLLSTFVIFTTITCASLYNGKKKKIQNRKESME